MTSTAPPSTPPTAAAAEGESDVLPLGDVEAELARRVRAIQAAGQSPVLRAHMSNLIIYCDSPEIAEAAEAAIPSIFTVHPARVFLLVAGPSTKEEALSATVHVRASRSVGGARICSEQITLRAGGSGVDHFPFAIRELAIGDLPTNIWWASHQPPAFAGPRLFDLAEHAQQVIYDSFGWVEPARGVAATAPWLEKFERGYGVGERLWRVASDLNWRRLKMWRRILSQALDPATAPGALDSTTEVLIEHGPHAVVQAWELASWMASRLGWKVTAGRIQPGAEIAWQFRAPHGSPRVRIDRLSDGPTEIRRVRIACSLGGKLGALDVVAEDDGRLCVRPEGIPASPRTLAAPAQPIAELIARQLSDRDRDPVFRESMAVAQVLAQSVLH